MATKNNQLVRYFLDSDEDGHSYVIPEAKRAQWNKWMDIPWSRGKVAPKWATQVEDPSSVNFTDPSEGLAL